VAQTAIAVAVAIQARGQGYIVNNGVTFGGFDGVGYSVSVIYDPTNGFTTGFDLEPNGKTPPSNPFVNTFKFDPIANVGVRVFLVGANDPIAVQQVLGGTYTELTAANSYVFNSGTPFFLGLYTGDQSFAPPNGVYSNPLFGWAELENNQGAIEFLGGALEFQGGGIYAGTENIIPAPEPSTVALLCLGASLFCMYWLRSSSRDGNGVR
jgi:hypothetical protein